MLKRKSLMFFTLVIATFALFAATSAAGGPCPNDYPCNMYTLGSFLLNEDCGVEYFNPVTAAISADVCEPIGEFDFVGAWYITAIALEADYHVTVAEYPTMGASFSSEDCTNWGLFKEINFDVVNLLFTDDHSGSNFLDPFCDEGTGPNCGAFQVCRLKQDSNLLDYLADPINLRAGDLIIGWNDSGGDGDYDDIVIVARQESRALLIPTLVKSKIEYTQTDPGTGPGDELTCKISIEEDLLPDKEAAIKVTKITGPSTRDCDALVKLITELTFGEMTAVEKAVTSFPLKKWIGTKGSPGEFTYCFPSGYCVVFTF